MMATLTPNRIGVCVGGALNVRVRAISCTSVGDAKANSKWTSYPGLMEGVLDMEVTAGQLLPPLRTSLIVFGWWQTLP